LDSLRERVLCLEERLEEERDRSDKVDEELKACTFELEACKEELEHARQVEEDLNLANDALHTGTFL